MSSVILPPDCEYVRVWLVMAGPAENFDFDTLSCQVPTTGSDPAAMALPLTAAAIAIIAHTSSVLIRVSVSCCCFAWCSRETGRRQACAGLPPRARAGDGEFVAMCRAAGCSEAQAHS